MPRTSDAKTRFIETAARLFRRRGYDGVGLTEIIAEADAPKGSFYHHFPGGKEELAEHALRRSAERFLKTIDQVFGNAPTFPDAVKTLFETFADWFEGSGWRDGCPITSIVLDTTPASASILAVTQEALESWSGALADHAKRLGVEGDIQALSTKLLMALEGAWILARVTRSREPFRLAAEMVTTVRKDGRSTSG
jgi:TetR/AcrR family transcriptional repressor of lmrAB and yxaGH operons